MRNFCSLWDSNYYDKGMAMIASLRRHVKDWRLYVLCLDEGVHYGIRRLMLDNVKAVELYQVENDELMAAGADRTWQEYVWTLASYWTYEAMRRFELASVAYIDADLYFFADLAPLYEEIGRANIAIIPHRFSRKQQNIRANGIYNVGWVYFTQGGLDCLRTWRDQCLGWCKFQVTPDGRMADQGYLNDWPERWGTHVVQHLGADLGPWCQASFTYSVNGNGLTISDGQRTDPLLFYHFHGFEYGRVWSRYKLAPMVVEHIYKPYEAELRQIRG